MSTSKSAARARTAGGISSRSRPLRMRAATQTFSLISYAMPPTSCGRERDQRSRSSTFEQPAKDVLRAVGVFQQLVGANEILTQTGILRHHGHLHSQRRNG